MGDYRDSSALRQSDRRRPDGSPRWPMTLSDVRPPAMSAAEQRKRHAILMRRAQAAGMVA